MEVEGHQYRADERATGEDGQGYIAQVAETIDQRQTCDGREHNSLREAEQVDLGGSGETTGQWRVEQRGDWVGEGFGQEGCVAGRCDEPAPVRYGGCDAGG